MENKGHKLNKVFVKKNVEVGTNLDFFLSKARINFLSKGK